MGRTRDPSRSADTASSGSTRRWSPSGFPLGTPFDAIVDCYALNVSGEAAWACYYSSFTIVRAHGQQLEGWHNDVRGATALITDGRRLALIGG